MNYKNSVLVEYLFQQNKISWLNTITGAKKPQRLEFYLGRAHEKFFGPLAEVIGGLGFAAFAILFLKKATPFKFGVAVFLYLLFTKFNVLLFPPYGDAIGGPFAEAVFLKDDNFNYYWLAQQAGYGIGGPKVYVFSIYPTYLAILMKLLPWPEVFLVINHLVIFAMVATIATLLRSILLKVDNPISANLATLLLLAIPSFQAQVEAINMEIPSAFFIMLSAYFLIERKIHWAGFMTILAVCIKGTEVLACFAIFLVSLGLFFGFIESPSTQAEKKMSFNYKILAWGVGLLVLSFLKVLSKFLINDQNVSQGMLKFGIGWFSLHQMPIFYFYLVSLAIFLSVVWISKVRREKGSAWPLQLSAQELYTAWVMFIYAGMWFALFFNFYAVSPRYRVSLYPFLVFAVLYAISLLLRLISLSIVNADLRSLLGRTKEWGLACVIAITFWGAYGAFYVPMEENDHVLLERSLEYRNDLEVNRRIAKSVEAHFSNFQIVAPFIIAQTLAIPELGYVKKKLDVMIYGFYCTYRQIQLFPGLKNVKLAHTLYVGVKVAPPFPHLPYPVNPDDRVAEEVQYGNKKAWLFFGGISIDSVLRVTNMIKLKELSEGEKPKNAGKR